MKAYCLMSYAAVEKAVKRLAIYGKPEDQPSLLIADYESGLEEEFACLFFLKIQPAFAGLPLFIMCNEKTKEVEEHCYGLGATVVVTKPLSETTMLRIERTSWQHEMTRSYEQLIQQQANELESAKEIKRLNEMLRSRNELLNQIFGKYFTEDVVESILEEPTGSRLGGKKAVVTVLMADLRGFTSLSDRLSGDVVVDILDNFLEEMTRIILNHKGTVIEIIGDEILAVFGAPIEIEKSECNAMAAAIDMQNAMKTVNKYNKSKEYPGIEMGIGIHKGEVFIGNIGSEYLMRYNVIGSAVNLCSRIESYTFGGQILASYSTFESMKDSVTIGDSFWISMKGFRKQIPICEIFGIEDGDDIYQLVKERAKQMRYLNNSPRLMVYVIQDKFVGEYSIPARAIEISDKKLLIETEDSDISSLTLHCEVELLIAGHNAYAKVVKVNSNRLMLRFTYQSEGFYEECVSMDM